MTNAAGYHPGLMPSTTDGAPLTLNKSEKMVSEKEELAGNGIEPTTSQS